MDESLKLFVQQLRQKALDRREERKRKALAEIEAEYDEDVKAINRAVALGGESDGTSSPTTAEFPPPRRIVTATASDDIGPAAATREAIQNLPPTFNVRDIDEYIQTNHPNAKIDRTAISSVLNKLMNAGSIEIIAKAIGRKPGTYRRKSELPSDMFGRAKAV